MIDELVDLANRWDRAAERAEARAADHERRAESARQRAARMRAVSAYYRQKALGAVAGRGPLAAMFDTFAMFSRHVKVGR